MKRMIGIGIWLGLSQSPSHAQGLQDWFDQDKEKTRYLTEQIAALQVLDNDINLGYQADSLGLGNILGYQSGEFTLHSDYIQSLDTLNPSIKNWAEVGDILRLHGAITNLGENTLSKNMQSGQFSPAEIGYIQKVYTTLNNDCQMDIETVTQVITNHDIRMTDDERMGEIHSIWLDMLDKYAFAKSFAAQAVVLAGQRTQDQQSLKTLQQWYDTK